MSTTIFCLSVNVRAITMATATYLVHFITQTNDDTMMMMTCVRVCGYVEFEPILRLYCLTKYSLYKILPWTDDI